MSPAELGEMPYLAATGFHACTKACLAASARWLALNAALYAPDWLPGVQPPASCCRAQVRYSWSAVSDLLSAVSSPDLTAGPPGRAEIVRAEARSYSPDRWFTTRCSWRTAPGRFAHVLTWVTAWCSAVRAAALDISSVPSAAACWAA